MKQPNGNTGPQLAPERLIGISYECVICDHKSSVNLAIPPGCPGVQIPEFCCPKCKGLPVMAKTIPQDLPIPRIVQPLMIPTRDAGLPS